MTKDQIMNNPIYASAVDKAIKSLIEDFMLALYKYSDESDLFKELHLPKSDRFSLIHSTHLSAISSLLIYCTGAGATQENQIYIAKTLIDILEKHFLNEEYSPFLEDINKIKSEKNNVLYMKDIKNRIEKHDK